MAPSRRTRSVDRSPSSEEAQLGSGNDEPSRELPGLAILGAVLLRLGALAFGGLGAALALLERELVERRGWISERDVSDALAFTKPLPGSTVVQVVAFLGWRLRGWPGAVVAAGCFIAPAGALMTVAAAGSAVLPDTSVVTGLLTGIHTAVVGLLAAAMWRLARSEAGTPALGATLAGGLVAGLFVNAALVVVGAGVLGALAARGVERA